MKKIYLLLIILFIIPLISANTKFGVFPLTSTNEAMTYSGNRIIELNVTLVTKFESWNFRQIAPDTSYLWKGIDTYTNKFLEGTNSTLFLRITPWGINPDDGSVNWYCDDSIPDKQPDEFSCIFKTEYEDNFKDYINNLTNRYKNNITKISFSNEWTGSHFVGDEYDYVKYANWVYDITKTNSPTTIVVLGSITSNPMRYYTSCILQPGDTNYIQDIYFKGQYLNEIDRQEFCNNMTAGYNKFLYALANAKYDMVDIHLYDDYDYWDEYINALRIHTNKPIIVSEFGGPNPNDPLRTDETYQAEELRNYLDKLISLNIPEAYFFQLIQSNNAYHSNSGLIKLDENQNPIIKLTYNIFINRYDSIIPPVSIYDLNNDLLIDIQDLIILASEYNAPSEHDTNNDGIINILDLIMMVNNFT